MNSLVPFLLDENGLGAKLEYVWKIDRRNINTFSSCHILLNFFFFLFFVRFKTMDFFVIVLGDFLRIFLKKLNQPNRILILYIIFKTIVQIYSFLHYKTTNQSIIPLWFFLANRNKMLHPI